MCTRFSHPTSTKSSERVNVGFRRSTSSFELIIRSFAVPLVVPSGHGDDVDFKSLPCRSCKGALRRRPRSSIEFLGMLEEATLIRSRPHSIYPSLSPKFFACYCPLPMCPFLYIHRLGKWSGKLKQWCTMNYHINKSISCTTISPQEKDSHVHEIPSFSSGQIVHHLFRFFLKKKRFRNERS